MSYTCPTVKVVSPESPDGFMIINESDLTPEHEIWEDVAAHKPIMSLQEVMQDEVVEEPQAAPQNDSPQIGKRGRPPHKSLV